jgi:hypothetical protein
LRTRAVASLLLTARGLQMSPAKPSLLEVYLLVDQPRQRLGHWSQVLAALDSPLAPPLAALNVYYDPTCDEALIDLRYDPVALGERQLGFVIEVAQLAEVGIVQPERMTEAERRRYLSERITRCTQKVKDQRSVVAALTELVRRLREAKSIGAPRTIAAPLPTQPPPIPVRARGTRDEVTPSGGPTVAASPNALAAVSAKTAEGSGGLDKESVPRAQPPPPPAPPRREQQTTEANAIAWPHMSPTREVPPDQLRRLATETQIVDVDDLPPLGDDPTKMIYARYLRSGRWVATRVGALSLKGAALMAGALPRLHDHVDVALSFGGHKALVRGAVGKVSTPRETKQTGAALFSVKFELDDAARRQLTALLTAARAERITITPPPPRATRRFPVEWPVCLGTSRGAIKADALDVSSDGMFVRPAHVLTAGSTVNFSAVLDDAGAPVAGRAKVTRHVSEAQAKSAGFQPGYGLQITEMAESDRLRWLAFIARVERRAERRVLIGAAPARLAELQTALAAVGYAVTGGTDPGALVQLATGETRPVDAAVIDGEWQHGGASTAWLESLFTARGVPCVTLHGDGRKARGAVDKLLEVFV